MGQCCAPLPFNSFCNRLNNIAIDSFKNDGLYLWDLPTHHKAGSTGLAIWCFSSSDLTTASVTLWTLILLSLSKHLSIFEIFPLNMSLQKVFFRDSTCLLNSIFSIFCISRHSLIEASSCPCFNFCRRCAKYFELTLEWIELMVSAA